MSPSTPSARTTPGHPADPPSGDGPSARTRAATIAFALLLLFAVLLLPAHPRDFAWSVVATLPLELPLVVLALLSLPGVALARAFRTVVTVAVGTLLLLRLADLGSELAFSRPFNPLVELHLIGDGWNLASRSIGLVEAALGVLLAIGGFALALVLLYRGLGGVARLTGTARRTTGAVAGVALVAGGVALLAAPAASTAPDPRDGALVAHVQADFVQDVVTRAGRMRRAIADQEAFVAELARDPLEIDPPTFDALAGRDVAVIFVESYGRSFVDDARFREAARERIRALDGVVTSAGLHARSGWLTSPIRGGRSWLAHASFASGLKIDGQARFDRLVASPRASLNRLFGRAGWRTAGLMPAITLDWPEGAWYGFDDTHDAHTLGYAGEPFGWVTMPDQYTLTAFENLVRKPSGAPAATPPDASSGPLPKDAPVMAELALISSHAPWTPVSTLVPWEDVGDGSVFDGRHRFGGTVAEVWSDQERVRDHYALALDYTLETIGGYLERHGEGALFVILGDHQPPSIIDGWGTTADVPVHLVADDPALLERLPAALFSRGMQPADDLPSQPMESMRETLARSFSTRPASEAGDGDTPDGRTTEPATRP